MTGNTIQDGQIFKERCADSPGILVLCQGDWRPTPERVRLFEERNYYILTAANGFQDIVDWLPQPRCIGAMFAHPETVAQARVLYPDKVIERFEGVGSRFLRSLTQELPYNLHNAGVPFVATVPAALKTLDIVSVFSPVMLKRGHLLMEALLEAKVTAYLFAQSLGSNPQLLASFLDVVKRSGKKIDYFHYPFDPYALMRIDGRLVIDCRPIGANNSIVSAYLARARLFVHTSTTEGISNSVMEALLNDVPVLLCEDIRGPLQNLSQQLPQCFTRSAPDARALAAHIQSLLSSSRPHGSVRSSFLGVINPFEINRSVILGAQDWFARNGLPWKGHCLGLFSGVQSKIDLAGISAEESYRGGRHIYPNATETAQCIAFQLQIASAMEKTDHAAALTAEQQYMNDFLAQPLPEPSTVEVESTLDSFIARLAEFADVRQVLVIGMSSGQRYQALVDHFGHNSQQPQVYCLEDTLEGYRMLEAQYRDKPFIHCHHASSVPFDAFPNEDEVARFYQETPGKLKDFPLATIQGWLQNDIARMNSSGINDKGIHGIQDQAGINAFDMVIIDGREFTGFAELQQLNGANIILLGCTRTFKNYRSTQFLLHDPAYELLFSDPDVGNGFAGFVKAQYVAQGGLSQVDHVPARS